MGQDHSDLEVIIQERWEGRGWKQEDKNIDIKKKDKTVFD